MCLLFISVRAAPPSSQEGRKSQSVAVFPAIQLLSSPHDLDQEVIGKEGEHSCRRAKGILLLGSPCAVASAAGVGGEEPAQEPLLCTASRRAPLCHLMQCKGGQCLKSSFLTRAEDISEHCCLPVSSPTGGHCAQLDCFKTQEGSLWRWKLLSFKDTSTLCHVGRLNSKSSSSLFVTFYP